MAEGERINDPYKWSTRQEKAAVLLADGTLTQAEVAKQVGVGRQTVVTWMQQPEYRAHVAGLRAEIIAAVKALGIANKEARLLAYNDRHQRLSSVIHARAKAYADTEEDDEGFKRTPVPGGDSGLLAKQLKLLGKGEDAVLVTEFAVDTGLLKSMLDLEKQVAQEMGEFVQRTDVTSGDQPVKAYIAVDVDAV